MPSLLITVNELLTRLKSPDTVILDCSYSLAQPEQGFQDYLRAHIPGAVYAHLEKDLSSRMTPTTGRHPLPSKKNFAHSLASWGWQPGKRIVVYDSSGGTSAAARAWWLCRYFGLSDAYLLDGGLNAWMQAGFPLESNLPAGKAAVAQPAQFTTNENMVISTAEMQAVRGSAGTLLLDGRAAIRYQGLEETIDTVAGHIPGAVSLPVTSFLQEDQRLLTVPAIQRLAANLIPAGTSQVVYYCGSGVTAVLGILALELAGYPGIKLYPGSFSEWIRQPRAEIASLNHRN